ncbi:hypothetical protein HGRIS_001509 [Hohenbuehelia grisea]|uniref:Uncharacterized protein n=1 Tax=Hohenbuehelia grisea TaxID=104357 RepID=A0ABR3JRC7_9AGAR
MNKGVPTLQVPHTLSERGKALTAEQAQLLKLIGERMVTFRVGLIARWEASSGEVVQVGAGVSAEERASGDASAASDDEGMSE